MRTILFVSAHSFFYGGRKIFSLLASIILFVCVQYFLCAYNTFCDCTFIFFRGTENIFLIGINNTFCVRTILFVSAHSFFYGGRKIFSLLASMILFVCVQYFLWVHIHFFMGDVKYFLYWHRWYFLCAHNTFCECTFIFLWGT